jgi:lipopolysaccharide biosynthesis glycosyltransferase
MNICFCINNSGAFGLGATLNSLMQNCSDTSEINLFFFCASLDNEIKKSVVTLLSLNHFNGNYNFIDFNPEETFKNYRSLQGDYTAYGRLLIADVIKAEQIIYLDSDLIIEMDILKLKDVNLDGKIIGAAARGSSFKYNLEQNFYCNVLHLDPETTSFNSGILVINITDWNKCLIKKKLLAIADKYPNELLAADQTLLNAFFAGNFFHLPFQYNVLWYAVKKPAVDNNAVFHFVGSPKPWDFFGRQLHTGYKKWKQYNPASWENVLNKFKTAQFKRSWNIRRSYLKILLKK